MKTLITVIIFIFSTTVYAGNGSSGGNLGSMYMASIDFTPNSTLKYIGTLESGELMFSTKKGVFRAFLNELTETELADLEESFESQIAFAEY